MVSAPNRLFVWVFRQQCTAIKTITMLVFLIASQLAQALEHIAIDGNLNGLRLDTSSLVYHDTTGALTLPDIILKARTQGFSPWTHPGSAGLQPGAFWAYFEVRNTTSEAQTLFLEYVDHQLIQLQAYSLSPSLDDFRLISDLSLDRPFSHRPVPHNRFVVPLQLEPLAHHAIMVKMGSQGQGYVFPNLRLWSEKHFREAEIAETSLLAFLGGGVLLMAMLAVVAGYASKETFFYTYAIYCISKILAWGTIFGFTHQWLLRDQFHWSYMSLSGALSIFCGLLFTRQFLHSAAFTPKLDRVLKFMMLNSLVLATAAVLEIKALALISITLALLLYPVNCITGFLRWRQGSKEAGVFAIAWGFLMAGLMTQALRDLGFVGHNFINYYWPPVASYTEVIVILVAMGVKLHNVRLQKEAAEYRYTEYLENSKHELEDKVTQRTRELADAKHRAEVEARTDDLTGTRNRRSFFADSQRMLMEAKSASSTFSLLMFDIDKFKSINDKFGHAVGDKALCHFTRVISDNIREQDVFGRLGGEEFSLLLNASPETALNMAERLRAAVDAMSIETDSGPLNFTTSIGIAHFNNQEMIEELIKLADDALYKAKQRGRNQVVVAQASV